MRKSFNDLTTYLIKDEDVKLGYDSEFYKWLIDNNYNNYEKKGFFGGDLIWVDIESKTFAFAIPGVRLCNPKEIININRFKKIVIKKILYPDEHFYRFELFEIIINNIKNTTIYSIEEQEILVKMFELSKNKNLNIYSAEIFKENHFDFKIDNYDRIHKMFVSEIKKEIVNQIIVDKSDYEEVSLNEIIKYFEGLTVDIKLINYIEKCLDDKSIKLIH